MKKKTQENRTGKRILVNVGPVENRVVIVNNGRMEDYFMEREGVDRCVGNIYKAIVDSVVPGIEAAFLNIGLPKNGFLHASDVTDKTSALKELLDDDDEDIQEESERSGHRQSRRKGPQERIDKLLKLKQELLVQVVKEGISTKGPRVTTFISIAGRYIVLTPFDSHIGVSRRIRDRVKRDKIRGIIDSMKLPQGIGCIVRTLGEDITEKELKEEMSYLLHLWEKVKIRTERNRAPSMVYEEYGAVLMTLRDKFTNEVEEVVVDSKDEYAKIMKFLQAFRPELSKKVRLYTGQMPLFQSYDLEREIDAIFERKVTLKSGGYLVIEQTEGLIAIDVNTGKFTGRDNLESTAFKTNLEAAKEIPRQLVLRDIGGIVIIDFIDMEIRSHREDLFNLLRHEMRSDKARISLRAISQFGIVEMTRQRMRKSLESSSHIECPYCNGKGMIKSAETTALEAARDIERALSNMTARHKSITVTIHPDIHAALVSNQARMLSEIQRKHRCHIELREDAALHREDVVIDRK